MLVAMRIAHQRGGDARGIDELGVALAHALGDGALERLRRETAKFALRVKSPVIC